MRKMTLLSTLALSIALASGPTFAASERAAPEITRVTEQGGDIYRFAIGDVRVIALSDGSVPQDLHNLLQRTTPARIDALLARNFQTNPVEASINAYLVELPGRLVLIDTGSGELFGPSAGGKLVDSLRRAGVGPEQVTDILLTHIHSDHAGGLVRGGQRVFTNAVVHVGKADLDYFADPTNAERTHYDHQHFDVAALVMKPYLDAGKVIPITKDGAVLPGIIATFHAGHTPGSAFYTLESKGESIVFVGDIVHSAAVQFPSVATTITYDQDANRAATVRADAFGRFARERTLIAVPHMPFPGVGHVQADGAGFAWVPVTYTNRTAN
ncbi:MBL fold metallo-hydrolase [Xanthobacter sp. DSM 24535]|uniref:MBL fold metallo-hydrolase n=1 Tax=Roseixanthobacter psychrophilus TaxID=3119917 RepID=UPI00372713B4